MSTVAYSQDFRNSIINYVDGSHSQKEAATVFGIHRNTIGKWLKRRDDEGNFEAKKAPGAEPRVNVLEFRAYVLENPNKTLVQLGKEFKISDARAHITGHLFSCL